MERSEWDALFESLRESRGIVSTWAPEGPNPLALRCQQSRHRTLAHLRACQEQWMIVVDEFLVRNNPNVTVLHPWRKFDQAGYANLPWEANFSKYMEDRARWLRWRDTADWTRGGKWNRKPDTIGGLTAHLANHEAYHLGLFR